MAEVTVHTKVGIGHYDDDGRYEGEYQNNLRNGKGIYYYDNGDRYDGDWKDDKKNGRGRLMVNCRNTLLCKWK